MAGASLGELALIDGKPRFCTAECLTRGHLIKISRDDFEKAVEDSKRKKIKEKVDFIKKIPLVSKSSRTFLGRLSLNMIRMQVNKDYVLYNQGDKADRVYIIEEGEFSVTKKCVLPSQAKENIQEILDDPKRACKLNNKFFNKNNVKQIDKHIIAIVKKFGIVGMEDVIYPEEVDKFGTYESSVMCMSKDASLWYIMKEHFMRLK
jgi:CRP-like cAMP-binding protein